MIIKIEEQFYLKVGEEKYCFSGDEYEKLILFLTNPNTNLSNDIQIDESILDEDDKYKAKVYKDFLEKYIISRQEIDKEIAKDENIDDETNDNNISVDDF